MKIEELRSIICELYNIKNTTPLIENHIKKFINEHGYSIKDIGRALYYYIKVLNRTPDIKYGIGIVPYVMNEATVYFEKIKKEQLIQDELIKQAKKTNIVNVNIVNSSSSGIKKPKINIDEL